MAILLFIVVLVVLIVVHELGHFFVAKWAGMRVEEFGLGYPPRALTLARVKGTEYTLNWLPFGGFVKIWGEDGEAEGHNSFVGKSHAVQALVLAAGIIMNLLFAWVLLSITLALGMPRELTSTEAVLAPDAHLVVSQVVAESPAALAGLLPGDTILKAEKDEAVFVGADSAAFTEFVANEGEEEILLTVLRDGAEVSLTATPEAGVIVADPERAALGVGISSVGTIRVSPLAAPIEGAKLTWLATGQVAQGLVHFFAGVFTFSADLSQVSGPVGIAGAVGEASQSGIVALLTLTAVISINLALINIVPVPALDGGRLLFVLIEAVTRRRIPERVAGAMNAVGFGLLILLMLVITGSDLLKLFA